MTLPPAPEDGKYRILVVEDDEPIARLILVHLNMAGFDCRLAFDGNAGWRAFSEVNPHLVMSDVTMPGISGWALATKIREISPVPIIMTTASGSDESQLKGLKIGADDYISKPFNPKLLVARVIAHLRRVYRYDAAHTQAVDTKILPSGWGTCDSCNYMGPQSKFEGLDAQKGRQFICPHCQSHQITFSLG